MKVPLTLAGIEPATFRFIAQHLNHCATAVPLFTVAVPVNYTNEFREHFEAIPEKKLYF